MVESGTADVAADETETPGRPWESRGDGEFRKPGRKSAGISQPQPQPPSPGMGTNVRKGGRLGPVRLRRGGRLEQKEVMPVYKANPAAARLTKAMRDAMKHQGLSVSDLAEVIERQTGVRCTPHWVYRATDDYDYPVLIRVSPHLVTLARALNLDPLQLVVDAVSPDLSADPREAVNP